MAPNRVHWRLFVETLLPSGITGHKSSSIKQTQEYTLYSEFRIPKIKRKKWVLFVLSAEFIEIPTKLFENELQIQILGQHLFAP